MNTVIVMVVTVHEIGSITNNIYAFDNERYAREIMLNDTQDFIKSLPEGQEYKFTEQTEKKITITTENKVVVWSIGTSIIEYEQDERSHYNGLRFDFKR